jgi:hypothetical protein
MQCIVLLCIPDVDVGASGFLNTQLELVALFLVPFIPSRGEVPEDNSSPVKECLYIHKRQII